MSYNKRMTLQIYTDGGSINNPGQAAFAYILFNGPKQLFSHRETIGIASNNIAEYTGLIRALEKTKELMAVNKLKMDKIEVFSDSLLMVNQLNGLFKVKNAKLRGLVLRVRALECEINLPVIYIHIYREKNMLADALVKKALGSSQ